MSRRRSWPVVVGLAVAQLAWLGARGLEHTARAERATWPDLQDRQVLPPPDAAPFLSLGYRELAADLAWVRTTVYFGTRSGEDGDLTDLEPLIDLVLAFDPTFEKAYEWAGQVVTYQKQKPSQEAIRASIDYLERGMEQFPDDYEFAWLAGLRYYLDLYDDDPEIRRQYRERGVELIERAIHKPNAPPDLGSLAASLRYQLGQHERALRQLREVILTTENEDARKKMMKRYQAMADSPEAVSALESAKERFDEAWKAELPYVPPAMYVLLGDEPSPVIDFEELATERELIGAQLLEAPDEPSDATDTTDSLEPDDPAAPPVQ